MTSYDFQQKDMSNVLATLKEIAELVMTAAEAGSLEEALGRIAQATQMLVKARYVALGIPDGQGSLRYFKVVGVTPEQIKAIGQLPQGRGLLGVIMRDRVVLRLERISDDPRSVGFPPNHPVMTSLLGVPVQVGTQLFGMLYLCDREDGLPFTEEDQWLVETLAGYAALAIAGVNVSEQQGRLILLEERERLARELHDGIIQSLYAIGMQLELMRLSGNVTDDGLKQATASIDAVIEDLRRYILDLHNENSKQQTMRERIQDLVSRIHVPDKTRITIDVPDRFPPFPIPVFESVCQIAHEALSNAMRHSGAENITLTITENDQAFRLIVADDGRGFTLEDTPARGMGLRNMRERARIHGGKVHIQTAPGEGTRLTVTIPKTAT